MESKNSYARVKGAPPLARGRTLPANRVSTDWDCGPRAVDAPRHDAGVGRLPRPTAHWCPGHTAGKGGINWNFSRATCIFIGVLGVFGVFQQFLIGEEEQKPDTPPIFHGVFWCVWGGYEGARQWHHAPAQQHIAQHLHDHVPGRHQQHDSAT